MLLYQLLRENVFASAFCMGGNKSGKTSADILPLYLDKYKICNDTSLSDEDRRELEADIEAEKRRLESLAAQNKE